MQQWSLLLFFFILLIIVVLTPTEYVVEVLHHTTTWVLLLLIIISLIFIFINVNVILFSHLFKNRFLHGYQFIFCHVLEISFLNQGVLLLLHHLVHRLRLVKLIDHLLDLLCCDTTISLTFLSQLLVSLSTTHEELLRINGCDVICEVWLL